MEGKNDELALNNNHSLTQFIDLNSDLKHGFPYMGFTGNVVLEWVEKLVFSNVKTSNKSK
jgi:hypothetical protein